MKNRLNPGIIIVDDASNDSTCEIIRTCSGFLDARLSEIKLQIGLADKGDDGLGPRSLVEQPEGAFPEKGLQGSFTVINRTCFTREI